MFPVCGECRTLKLELRIKKIVSNDMVESRLWKSFLKNHKFLPDSFKVNHGPWLTGPVRNVLNGSKMFILNNYLLLFRKWRTEYWWRHLMTYDVINIWRHRMFCLPVTLFLELLFLPRRWLVEISSTLNLWRDDVIITSRDDSALSIWHSVLQ